MTHTCLKVLLLASALASAHAFVCDEYVKVRIQLQLHADHGAGGVSCTLGCLTIVSNTYVQKLALPAEDGAIHTFSTHLS
jgi:hypothetical protein